MIFSDYFSRRKKMSSRLSDFMGNDKNLEKLAEVKVAQELQLRKIAEHSEGTGMFIGKGFTHMLIKCALAEASGAEVSGINNELPPTAAQTPPKGGVELPTDAPGPNEKLVTTGPNSGEQYNNELLTRKIEEKRLQAGLANVQNEGVATLSGAPQGTSALFSIDH